MDVKDLFSSHFDHFTHFDTRYKMSTHTPYVCYQLQDDGSWMLLSQSKRLASKYLARKWLRGYARETSKTNKFHLQKATNTKGEAMGMAERRAYRSFALALKHGKPKLHKFKIRIHQPSSLKLNPILSRTYLYGLGDVWHVAIANLGQDGTLTKLKGGNEVKYDENDKHATRKANAAVRKIYQIEAQPAKTLATLHELGFYFYDTHKLELPHKTGYAWILDLRRDGFHTQQWMRDIHDEADRKGIEEKDVAAFVQENAIAYAQQRLGSDFV